jgi:hypothetical protein
MDLTVGGQAVEVQGDVLNRSHDERQSVESGKSFY